MLASLCWPFSNFRFCVSETGSISDRDRFAEQTADVERDVVFRVFWRENLWRIIGWRTPGRHEDQVDALTQGLAWGRYMNSRKIHTSVISNLY